MGNQGRVGEAAQKEQRCVQILVLPPNGPVTGQVVASQDLAFSY